MGPLEPGPGPARLQAGPLRSIEGGRRRGAVTVEIRRCGLVARGTRLDHGEADLSAAPWEIPRHGRPQGDDRADNSAKGQGRQSAVGTRRRRNPLRCRPARYTPAPANNSCSPANVRTKGFPVNPGAAMPVVNGCRKQDYAVLIVVGLPATH